MYFSFSGSRKSSGVSVSAIVRYSAIGMSVGIRSRTFWYSKNEIARADRLAEHDDHLAVRESIA